jgi:hypothetical protein
MLKKMDCFNCVTLFATLFQFEIRNFIKFFKHLKLFLPGNTQNIQYLNEENSKRTEKNRRRKGRRRRKLFGRNGLIGSYKI